MTTITAVETRFVRLPLAFSYSGGRGAMGKRPMGPGAGQQAGSVILLVKTDDGLTGLGDVIVKGGDVRAGHAAQAFVEAVIAHALVCQDSFDVELIMAKLCGITTHDSTVSAAGADIAHHDLMGKALGAPLYRLLGGKTRER